MPSARKLFAAFLLGQAAFAAAVPQHLARRADDTNLDVAAPFQASAPLIVRAAPVGKPLGKPNKPNDPADPNSQDPIDPNSQDPIDPNSQDPTEPGSQEPTEPGTEDPTDPGSQTPTDPNAPIEPSSADLNAPETPSDPNAPSCKGKRSGAGCGGDGTTPSTLAGKLGARKAGDGVADATPQTIGDLKYQDTTTPPSSPGAPAVDGGLEPVQAEAPAGSAMKSMNLKGYSKTLVRGAGNKPDDTPMLNMQSDPVKDMHVVVESKDKGVDATPKANQLPFSEVLGQSIDKQFGGNFGGKLQRVTQYHVANDDSEELLGKIWGGLQKSGNKGDVPLDLAEDSAWSQLGQSANGGALFRYSNDHFDRLQGWQPVRAEVYRQTFDFDPDLVFWHLTWVYGSQP